MGSQHCAAGADRALNWETHESENINVCWVNCEVTTGAGIERGPKVGRGQQGFSG